MNKLLVENASARDQKTLKNGALKLSKSEDKWRGWVKNVMISFMDGPMSKIQRKTTKKFFDFLCQPGLELTSTKRLLLLLLRLVKLTHSLSLCFPLNRNKIGGKNA